MEALALLADDQGQVSRRELWQMDVVGGVLLADGTGCKFLTGIDDHPLAEQMLGTLQIE